MKGIGVTQAMALGTVYVLEDVAPEQGQKAAADVEAEQAALQAAVVLARQQLQQLVASRSQQAADILRSHLDFLEEPAFNQEALAKIVALGCTAVWAVRSGIEELCQVFESFEDTYLQERAADVRDVGQRIVRNLLGREECDLSALAPGTVVVARDLVPSQTAQLNREHVVGFITEEGGKTGHTAIMARSLEIAAVVGCRGILQQAVTGDRVIIDALTGQVILNPTSQQLEEFQHKQIQLGGRNEELEELKHNKLVRGDGRPVLVAANIGSLSQAKTAKEKGADGVGLFRTEFLYMDRADMPSEEEQFLVYKEVALCFEQAPVIVRTLDVGGDKQLPYLEMPGEENPFLGVRAIRLCMQHQQLFCTQLRALLRAAVFGQLKIMFPMIGSVQELEQAKELLEQCKQQLRCAGTPFREDIQVGMMIEVPAAAVLAHQFAPLVDFFSIGTNDLTQYTLAVDRGNPQLNHLYRSDHPAVLALIKMTIEAARAQGIFCGMCGEMAGEADTLPLLAQYGLDEFSVGLDAIALTKSRLAAVEGISMEA